MGQKPVQIVAKAARGTKVHVIEDLITIHGIAGIA
jgi:hypothetical protein